MFASDLVCHGKSVSALSNWGHILQQNQTQLCRNAFIVKQDGMTES